MFSTNGFFPKSNWLLFQSQIKPTNQKKLKVLNQLIWSWRQTAALSWKQEGSLCFSCSSFKCPTTSIMTALLHRSRSWTECGLDSASSRCSEHLFWTGACFQRELRLRLGQQTCSWSFSFAHKNLWERGTQNRLSLASRNINVSLFLTEMSSGASTLRLSTQSSSAEDTRRNHVLQTVSLKTARKQRRLFVLRSFETDHQNFYQFTESLFESF